MALKSGRSPVAEARRSLPSLPSLSRPAARRGRVRSQMFRGSARWRFHAKAVVQIAGAAAAPMPARSPRTSISCGYNPAISTFGAERSSAPLRAKCDSRSRVVTRRSSWGSGQSVNTETSQKVGAWIAGACIVVLTAALLLVALTGVPVGTECDRSDCSDFAKWNWLWEARHWIGAALALALLLAVGLILRRRASQRS